MTSFSIRRNSLPFQKENSLMRKEWICGQRILLLSPLRINKLPSNTGSSTTHFFLIFLIPLQSELDGISEMPEPIFTKIISGGQTGVDRAALDVALQYGIPCGGWCPKGRKAEDGPIDARYPLKETSSLHYEVRIEANVIGSDGTLILTEGKPAGGTAYTIQMTIRHKKPYLIIDLRRKTKASIIHEWAMTRKIHVLNVAGPRESKIPGIYEKAKSFLVAALISSK